MIIYNYEIKIHKIIEFMKHKYNIDMKQSIEQC